MRQVAIVGGGKSWARAPFTDQSWEIWAHSSCCEGLARLRVDRWFDVHRPSVRAEPKKWSERYQRWLTDPSEGRTAPVYVLDGCLAQPDVPTIENADIPNHVVLPWEEMQAWLVSRGSTDREYVTSTGAWMLKLALFEGVDTIGIWGIDYEEHGEYLVQRPCMEHWIGFARALGVKVYVTPSSNLGRGFDGYRADLVHTHRPFRRAKGFQSITIGQAMGTEPYHDIPAEIQALIEEEKSRGIDTEAWTRAAQRR